MWGQLSRESVSEERGSVRVAGSGPTFSVLLQGLAKGRPQGVQAGLRSPSGFTSSCRGQ